jgi:hypothetical protein
MEEFLSCCSGARKVALEYSLAGTINSTDETTHRHFLLVLQSTRERVQITENSSNCISPVSEKHLSSNGIIANVVWVVEESRLSDSDEILKESLTGSGET